MDAPRHSSDTEAADRRWLAATLPFVLASLPQAPGRVVEIGCGDLGGFVPDLREAGHGDPVQRDPAQRDPARSRPLRRPAHLSGPPPAGAARGSIAT